MKWPNVFRGMRADRADKARLHLTHLAWRPLVNLLWWVLLGSVLVLLSLLVWRNRETLVAVLQTARYEYFVLAFFLYAAAILAVSLGWHFVMSYLGQRDLVLNVKVYVYTLVARRIPGTLWYVAGRATLYQRLGISKKISVMASSIEVILSVISGLIVGAPALFLQFGFTWVSIGSFCLVEVIGLALLHPSILSRILERIGHTESPSISMREVWSWLLAYVAMWIAGGLTLCSIVRALLPLNIEQAARIISLWSLTGVISFSVFLLPSNLGVTELTLSFMLSSVIPLSIAVVIAILVRALATLFDVFWSSLIIFEKDKTISTTIFRR